MNRNVAALVSAIECWGAPGSFQGFRWTQAGGMVALGSLPGGSNSQPFGVSGDGAVVVGWGNTATSGQVAFRWIQASGMSSLGFLPGDGGSEAWAASSDGSVVVGSSSNGSVWRAFRWTQAGGMSNLGFLPGGIGSEAFGVSADGSVVVGGAGDSSQVVAWNGDYQAFRWTQAGGMIGLGFLPGGTNSVAWAVSADGAVIVGSSNTSPGGSNLAIRWTQAAGMQSVAGSQAVQGAAGLASLGLFGAHHRSLLDSGLVSTQTA
jgi:probable HAF family extracellular repeat protein